MRAPPLSILFEDNHLLALNKPAGLPTMGAAEGSASVVTLARQYLKEKYDKPGAVYVGVVSRLDALVTGVVLLARTSKAAARLTAMFRTREVRKVYWALVEGELQPPQGACADWLRKNEGLHRMEAAAAGHPEAKEARLAYRTLARGDAWSILEVELETGRKHQIRVQLALRRHPILGDEKYGASSAFQAGIALHAREIELIHPVRKTRLHLVAPVPAGWRRYGVRDEEPGAGHGGEQRPE